MNSTREQYIQYINCVVVATVARAQLGSACCQLGGGGPQEIANKARKLWNDS